MQTKRCRRAHMVTGADTRVSAFLLGLSLTVYAVYTFLAKPYHAPPKT